METVFRKKGWFLLLILLLLLLLLFFLVSSFGKLVLFCEDREELVIDEGINPSPSSHFNIKRKEDGWCSFNMLAPVLH